MFVVVISCVVDFAILRELIAFTLSDSKGAITTIALWKFAGEIRPFLNSCDQEFDWSKKKKILTQI